MWRAWLDWPSAVDMAVLLVWTAKLHDCQESVFDIALTLGALEQGNLMKSKVACILFGRASS
jgi:hypothetical protein